MTQSNTTFAGRIYALAVAKDAANLVDLDASLAMSRATMRAVMALSPQAAQLVRYFAQQEIERLDLDCTEESQGAIALVEDALRLG